MYEIGKYKANQLRGIYRHNERKNFSYSNGSIDHTRTPLNYHIKISDCSYLKKAYQVKKENNIKGQIQKTSNIACELIFSSDKNFFEKIGKQNTKEYFEKCYDFVKQMLPNENCILGAVVHFDEETPHLHVTYMPVIKNKDGLKLSCSEFWKGYNSYGELQDNFNQYINQFFEMERGRKKDNRPHLSVKEFKTITNFDNLRYEQKSNNKTKKTLQNENQKLKRTLTSSLQFLNNLETENKNLSQKYQLLLKRTSELHQYTRKIEKENELLKQQVKTLNKNITEMKIFCLDIIKHITTKLNLTVKGILKNFKIPTCFRIQNNKKERNHYR